MFGKIFALFALIAVAFAAPNPKAAPEPSPQFLAYSSGLDYVYPSGVVPSVVSPYGAAGVPVAYSALAPGRAVFVH